MKYYCLEVRGYKDDNIEVDKGTIVREDGEAYGVIKCLGEETIVSYVGAYSKEEVVKIACMATMMNRDQALRYLELSLRIEIKKEIIELQQKIKDIKKRAFTAKVDISI